MTGQGYGLSKEGRKGTRELERIIMAQPKDNCRGDEDYKESLAGRLEDW